MITIKGFNTAKFKRCKLKKLSKAEVHKEVDIDDFLLKEKDSWYKNEKGEVFFFKRRLDDRLLGEMLSQKIFECLPEGSAEYEVVYLNGELGLLTRSFQDINRFRYYDLCNLHNLFPDFTRNHNYLTLKTILTALSYQNISNYNELVQQIIDRYVMDWMTHQTDGNPRNILFAYDKITKSLKVASSFDKERSFGINRKGQFDDEPANGIWLASIPYEDIDFKKRPYTFEEGLDTNIVSLYMDYPEQTILALKKAISINYLKIFNEYKVKNSEFNLSNEMINYLCDIIDVKGNQVEKILSL